MLLDGVLSIKVNGLVAYKIVAQSGGSNIHSLADSLRSDSSMTALDMYNKAVELGFGSYLSTLVIDVRQQQVVQMRTVYETSGYYEPMMRSAQDATKNPKRPTSKVALSLTIDLHP